MIKAVIFDMDGVLIDAKEWHYESLNKALQLFGYTIDRYDHLITYDGLPTKKKLEMLSIDQGLPKSLHKLLNELKQIYTQEIILQQCKPVFTCEYALSRLKSEGMKLAVASNSIRVTVEMMMEKAALTPYLDLMLSNQDVSKPKPDPEIYLTAMQRLGLQPDECLILEDNPHGLAAAKASGARVMKVDTTADVNYEKIKAHLL